MEENKNTYSILENDDTNTPANNADEEAHFDIMDMNVVIPELENNDKFDPNFPLNYLTPQETVDICLDAFASEENEDLELPSTSHGYSDVNDSKQSLGTTVKRKKVRKIPSHIRGLIGEANLRYARGDTETAEKLCYEVIRQWPRAFEAFLTLSQLLESKDPEKSLQLQFMAAITNRTNVELWINTAERALEMNKNTLAISCFNFALQNDKMNCDLHKRRIEVLEKFGNKYSIIKAYLKYSTLLLQNNDTELLNVSLKLAILYTEINDNQKAIENLDISFKMFPNLVTLEMVNIMLDLLISVENYTYCLDIFFQHCNIQLEVLIGEGNVINIISCSVPENLLIDIRVKFIICLVRLKATHLIEELLEPIMNFPNLDLIADLHLDLAETLMSSKNYDLALKVITPLIENEKLSLPAVWLKYGECLRGCKKYNEAEIAFQNVLQAAPQYTEAKKFLAEVLYSEGKKEEALQLLYQNTKSQNVDVGLLLKRINYLRDEKIYDELFNDVELLLLRHCIKIRHFEELRVIMYSSTQTEKLTRLQMMREQRGVTEEPTLTFNLTEELSIEDEYKLLKDTLQLCMEVKKYEAMRRLAFTAATSSKFKKIEEIQFWAFYAAICHRDTCNAYPLVRGMILQRKNNSLVWNFYGCILQFAEALRHTKFLLHYVSDHPQIKTLEANYCVESGSFKLAMMHYLNAIKDNCTSLYLLILGAVLLQICSRRSTSNKEKFMSTIFSTFIAYSNIRSREAFEEINYNLGRAYQHFGIFHIAEKYYKKVLEYKNPLAEKNPSMSLKREAAFNLHLIYKKSGSDLVARNVLMEYIVV